MTIRIKDEEEMNEIFKKYPQDLYDAGDIRSGHYYGKVVDARVLTKKEQSKLIPPDVFTYTYGGYYFKERWVDNIIKKIKLLDKI